MVIRRMNSKKAFVKPEIDIIMFDAADVISTSLAHSFPYNFTCSCECGVISNGTTSYI